MSAVQTISNDGGELTPNTNADLPALRSQPGGDVDSPIQGTVSEKLRESAHENSTDVVETLHFKPQTRNFGFLPIPRALRHNSQHAFVLSTWAVFTFGCSTMICASCMVNSCIMAADDWYLNQSNVLKHSTNPSLVSLRSCRPEFV